ncbi:MAG: hypothetical protein E6R03_14755 [Hyphomicrobiaceae bacterium]|nr:MAG: hypothetical protein E6R03_14755 [Hyphomicrobiaceae bacterium]
MSNMQEEKTRYTVADLAIVNPQLVADELGMLTPGAEMTPWEIAMWEELAKQAETRRISHKENDYQYPQRRGCARRIYRCACDIMKFRRGHTYPTDFFVKVVLSGLQLKIINAIG